MVISLVRRGVIALLLLAGCGIATPPTATTPPRPPTVKASEQLPTKPALTAPKAQVATPAPVASAPVAARATAPTLDLRSLEQRLKDTNAIGLLTKLALKNQMDDLVTRFRAFHDGHRPPTLTELRPAFELLLMKLLSLLQDKDTALANDINKSREAIWGVLSDRAKLAEYL